MKTVEEVKKLNFFNSFGHADESDIINAETILNIRFANEFKELLMNYGAFSCEGHEFTGICSSKRLNVIDVTLREREFNPSIDKMYVIERLNINGIIILQDSKGIVYKAYEGSKPIKINNSILDYLKCNNCS